MSEPAEVEAALREWEQKHALAGNSWTTLLVTVTALVDAAVAQERERCAQVVESHPHRTFEVYAAAIRQEPRP